MASVLSEIITSELKCYISVYSIWPVAKTQPTSLLATCCPPTPSSEWSGWTFLVCAVNRNCAFIIHIMNHARKRAAQCWDWSLCVCVCEGKSGGYEAPRQKREILCHHSTWGLFFKCPSVAFVTSSFHVTTRHLLLKFLNIFWNLPASCFIFSASLPFAGPIHSVPQLKGNQRNIAPLTLFHRLSPSVLHPPSSCSSVLHLELVSPSLAHTHNIWETSCIIQMIETPDSHKL